MSLTNGLKGKRHSVASRVPVLALNSPFNRYSPEKEQPVREADVKELLGCFMVYVRDIYNIRPSSAPGPVGDYNCAFQYVAYLKKKPSPPDMMEFFTSLVSFQPHLRFKRIGMFLSVVINECECSEFVFRIPHLEEPLQHVGYKNSKKIVVEGDVGNSAGCEMRGGELVIEGNAGASCGERLGKGKITVGGDAGEGLGEGMYGGEIVIEGNAGDCCGGIHIERLPHRGFDYESPGPIETPMRGGKITVRGNAGKGLGEGMLGGEIHIEGEIGSIGNVIHGKIYHKGELVVDK